MDLLAKPVGELVAERPALATVLEELGIDYCCGGRRPLAEACREAGREPEEVLRALPGSPPDPGTNWNTAPLGELIDQIVQVHHAYLKRELPALEQRAERVRAVHGASHPELSEVGELLGELAAELASHMAKEEQVLFPAIRAGEEGGGFMDVEAPIRVMEHEHDVAADLMRRLRQTTSNYRPPESACSTYRALYAGLEALEKDLRWHIHLENNILFPRAVTARTPVGGSAAGPAELLPPS